MAIEFAKTRLYKLRHLNPRDEILSDGELSVGVNCASVLDGREFLALIVMRPFPPQLRKSPDPFWVAHASSARVPLHSKSH
ncbi:hypothetical protein OXX79_004213 [Metschnikowia pulcherrima]